MHCSLPVSVNPHAIARAQERLGWSAEQTVRNAHEMVERKSVRISEFPIGAKTTLNDGAIKWGIGKSPTGKIVIITVSLNLRCTPKRKAE